MENPFDGGAGTTDTFGQVGPCRSWAQMVATLWGSGFDVQLRTGGNMSEVWKAVDGRDGKYEVSDLGRVRSFIGTRRVLRPFINAGGYLTVTLSAGGPKKNVPVHRLVALAFCTPGDGPVVRHKDGDKSNNEAANLAWGTQADNVRDSIRHGTFKPVVGSRKLKEFCVHGHPIDETPWAGKNRRLCLTCKRATARAWAAAKRASSR